VYGDVSGEAFQTNERSLQLQNLLVSTAPHANHHKSSHGNRRWTTS